jgi:hypothetical protein
VSNGWQYRDGTLDRCGYDPVLVAAAVVVGNLDWEVLRSAWWMWMSKCRSEISVRPLAGF